MAEKPIRVLCQWAMAYPDERCLNWASWGYHNPNDWFLDGYEGAVFVCDCHKRLTDPQNDLYTVRIA